MPMLRARARARVCVCVCVWPWWGGNFGSFCNFDYGNAGKCESCLPSRDACNSDGLPPKGARECVNTCFMRMKPARCGSGQAPPPPPPPPNPWGRCRGKCPANQCLYQGKCISHVNQATCGIIGGKKGRHWLKGRWCGGGHRAYLPQGVKRHSLHTCSAYQVLGGRVSQ